MRDIGKASVTVHVLAGTPDAAAKNRENLRAVCEQICCEAAGRPVRVKIEWEQSDGKVPLVVF